MSKNDPLSYSLFLTTGKNTNMFQMGSLEIFSLLFHLKDSTYVEIKYEDTDEDTILFSGSRESAIAFVKDELP